MLVPDTVPLTTSLGRDGKVKKVRNRVPKACSVCRQRKMKCDQARPHCGSCVEKQTIELCQYSQKPWEYLSTEKQLSNEILRLKMKIHELERTAVQQNDIDSPPISMSTARSSSATEDDNPLVELGTKFDKLIIKENKFMHYGTTSFLGVTQNDPPLELMLRKFFIRHRDEYYRQKEGLEIDPIQKKIDANDDQICWGSKNTDVNALLPANQDLSPEAQQMAVFTDSINPLLPTYENTMILTDVFFRQVYPLVPYVDESSFKAALAKILYRDARGKAYFNCTRGEQLYTVALSLMILRFAFLVLPKTDFLIDPNRIQDENLLKLCAEDVDIPVAVIDQAKNCIMNMPGPDNFLRKITFSNIQVLLFLKLYRSFCPEDGDDSTDSSIMLAMLIQMSKMHGFHRDPENFAEIIPDVKLRHLWRKIWYKLMHIDAAAAIDFGAPCIVGEQEWDCKLPALERDEKAYIDAYNSAAAIKNDTLGAPPYNEAKYNMLYTEQKVVEAIEIEYKITRIMREVTSFCHNMKVTRRTQDFVSLLRRVERCQDIVMESYADLLHDRRNSNVDDRVLNLQKSKCKSELYVLHYILSYLILLSSGDRDNINELFNNLYSEDSEFLVKTTEDALHLFRGGYDFVLYLTEDELSCSDVNRYQMFKRFYGPYDKLFLSSILDATQRSFAFLSSLILRFGTNCFSFTSLMRHFCNSQDSIELLKWFNIPIHDIRTNVDVSLDQQFSIMLFQYFKVFYKKCVQLRENFYICLKMSMMVRIFFTHLRLTYANTYHQLNGSFAVNKSSVGEDDSETSPEKEDTGEYQFDALDNLDSNFDLEERDALFDEIDEFRNEEELYNKMFNDPLFKKHALKTSENPHNSTFAQTILFNADNTKADNFDALLRGDPLSEYFMSPNLTDIFANVPNSSNES